MLSTPRANAPHHAFRHVDRAVVWQSRYQVANLSQAPQPLGKMGVRNDRRLESLLLVGAQLAVNEGTQKRFVVMIHNNDL